VRNAQISRDAAATKDGQSIESAKAGLSTAEVSKASATLKNRQSLANAESQLRTARLSLETTRLNNTLKLAPAKQADILSAQAAVDQAEANVTTAEETLAKTTLTAPIAATVTAVDAVVGDTASSGTGGGANNNNNAAASSAAFTLTDLDNLFVTAAFSEANAAKLQIGQNATVTFDALPNVNVTATVDAVALTANTSANVVSFAVRLKLDAVAVASGVKPGMTAQTEVVTSEAVDVVTVPSAAVRSVGGRRTVTVFDPVTKVQTPTQVTVGLRGTSTTEIKTGIADGTVLVLPTQNLAAISAATAAAGTGGLGGLGGGGGLPGGGLGRGGGGGGGGRG
jgi:multidrug efflux pump subunit AcrA (membrane-fusion protein)